LKLLYFCIILSISLFARENPFAPSALQGAGVGQIQAQTSVPLTPQKIFLPVDAVKLNKVIVNYQMIDGKIETKTFVFEKAIAPDIPLVIEQK
jgi:hypothetical protein